MTGSETAGEDIPHRLCRLALSGAGHMGVGIQSKTGGEVPQHTGHRLDVHSILQGQGGESMS